MIECKSIAEAMKVKGVIHIEAGTPVRAFVAGDDIPDHMKSDLERGIVDSPEVDEISILKAKVAALEAKVK